MGQESRSTPWPPPTFTVAFRHPASMEPAQRLERALRHEASLAFRLTKAASASRCSARGSLRDRRRARVPAGGRPAGGDRAHHPGPAVPAAGGAALGRAYERLWTAGSSGCCGAERAGASSGASDRRPGRAEPLASRQVDDALAFLQTIPFQELQRRGWHLQPNHFYWPLKSVEFLRDHPDLWHDRGLPKGVDWDLDRQVAFARSSRRSRASWPTSRTGPPRSTWAARSR